MEDYTGLVKSLRWLSYMFPETHPAKDDTDRISNSIHLYCKSAADAIERLQYFNVFGQEAAKIAHENELKWIPVTERLPGMYQQCWAACKMEGRENWVIEVQNYGIPYKKNPWGDCVLLESGEMQVYAWMPIDQPEPPKEDPS